MTKPLPGARTDWGRTLVNAVLFQCCWLACILGGDEWALAALLVLVLIHFGWVLTPKQTLAEVRLVLPVITLGIGFDSTLSYFNWLSFTDVFFASGEFRLIPFWLMVLWFAFATTLQHSLHSIIQRPWLAALFGALGAPWSYYLGDQLGAVDVASQGLILIALFWALLLTSVSYFGTKSDNSNPPAPETN